jgi:hypothetical protein
MKQVVGFLNPRMIGPRVKPRWTASATTVALVANGGMGQVMFSIPLATIESRADLTKAIQRVSQSKYSVPEFLDAINRGFKLRYGKSVEEYLAGKG